MTVATITWTDPTTRIDGSAIAPDSLTINIFDTSSPPLPGNPPLGSVKGGVQSFTTGALTAGVHAFVLDAVDSEGDTSVMTTPVSVTVGFSNPNPPTGVAVTLA